MQEQLITFETAKLAKEKGFNEICKTAYGRNADSLYYGNCTHKNSENIFLSAPTQNLLQKWLREVHNIYVEISFNQKYENPRFGYIVRTKSTCFHTRDFPYKTYEEALEIGLQESLKLIEIVKDGENR